MTTPSVAERLRAMKGKVGLRIISTAHETIDVEAEIAEAATTLERYEAALEDIKSLFCPHCDADLKATNALSGGGQKDGQ